jgi:hypothetical protein
MNIVVFVVIIAVVVVVVVVLPIHLSDFDRSDWPREVWR